MGIKENVIAVLWLAAFIISWMLGLYYTKKKGYLFKNKRLNAFAEKYFPLIYAAILTCLLLLLIDAFL